MKSAKVCVLAALLMVTSLIVVASLHAVRKSDVPTHQDISGPRSSQPR